MLYSAVCDNRDAVLLCNLVAVHNRRYLRHSYTGNNTRRAYGTRTNSYLYGICACFNQILCSLSRCHVSNYYRQLRKCLFDVFKCVYDISGMTVRRIDNYDINVCLYKSLYSVEHINRNSDARSAKKSSLCVLCRIGIFDLLFNIFYCDKSLKIKIVIYNREFLNSCLCQNPLCFCKRNSLFGSNKIFRCHGFFYFFGEILFEK